MKHGKTVNAQLNQLLKISQKAIDQLDKLKPLDLLASSNHIERISRFILAIEKRDVDLKEIDNLDNLSSAELIELEKQARKYIKDLPDDSGENPAAGKKL